MSIDREAVAAFRDQILSVATRDATTIAVAIDEQSVAALTQAAFDLVGILIQQVAADHGQDVHSVADELRADLLLIDATRDITG